MDEIKKIITIDAGNSLTILKDYKQHIDNLKSELSKLNSTSDEYKKKLEELNTAEERMNAIMSQTPTKLEEANTKYEELRNTLVQLEDQLAETNDAAKRMDIKGAIDDTTSSMNDLIRDTATTTDTMEEMGDMGVKEFGALLNSSNQLKLGLGVLDGKFGAIIKTLKICGKAAMTAGEEAAAAEALATAGLTLIISALVVIISHWEEISNFLDKAMDKVEELTGTQSKYTIAIKESEEEMQNLVNKIIEGNDEMNFQLKLMQAEGKSQLEVDKAHLNMLNKQKDELIDQYIKHDRHSEKEQELYDSQLNSLNEQIKSTKQQLILDQAREDTQKRINAELEEEKKKRTSLTSKSGNVTSNKQVDETDKQAQQILDRLKKANTDELGLLESKYQSELALLQKAGKDTELLTEEYEANRQAILNKYAKASQDERTKVIEVEIEQEKAIREQGAFEIGITEYETKQEQIDALYELDSEYYAAVIALREEELENFIGTEDERALKMKELDDLRREYSNRAMKYDADTTKQAKKNAEEEKKIKKMTAKAEMDVAENLFSSLSELMGKNSEEGKLFAIMATTIDTLQGAIAAYKSMAEIPVVGPALGVAAAAAVTAAGMANIKKIKETTKNSDGGALSGGASMPVPEMTTVSPLLNEQADINRMTSLSERQEGDGQNLRVYVVDQDIRDANHKAEIKEQNATY